MARQNEKCTINIFNNIKIYRVDCSDSHFKKIDLISKNGSIEFYLIEHLNQVNFKLDTKQDTLYVDLDANLNEINLKQNDLVAKRIEFKTKNSLNNRNHLAIEFVDEKEIIEFKQTFDYLKDIYKTKDDLKFGDIEMIDLFDTVTPKNPKTKEDNIVDICSKLEQSILNGNLVEASMYAIKLAEYKANLKIEPTRYEIEEKVKINGEEINDQEIKKLKTVKIIIRTNDQIVDYNKILEINLDPTQMKVGDLKQLVSNHFEIPIEEQMIIINEFATIDDELINSYSRSMHSKDSNNNASNYDLITNHFVVQVFSISIIESNFNECTREWICYECKYENIGDRCTHCALSKPIFDFKRSLLNDDYSYFKKQKQEITNKELQEKYYEIAAADLAELNENLEPFECDICLEENIAPFQGVILKECLHTFCKDCLRNHINLSDDPIIKCPYSKDYNCPYFLQDREIRALINDDDYSKYHMKSLQKSEATMQNTFHCKTPDCIGFCIAEELNFFDCPVCEKVNCLRCNIIHMGKTCKEYQDDLKLDAINDENAKKDKEALEKMISLKKAMYCPGCKIILCKNNDGGCDWLQCGMCKMEICWATRGPRWGPKGRGDTSGGCKCNFMGAKPCHPKCGNCH